MKKNLKIVKARVVGSSPVHPYNLNDIVDFGISRLHDQVYDVLINGEHATLEVKETAFLSAEEYVIRGILHQDGNLGQIALAI